MRSVRLVWLTSCILLAIAAEARAVYEMPEVVRFRLADPHSPTYYVRWEGRQLRMARSAKELRTVKPLWPARTKVSYDVDQGVYYRDRDYAEVRLAGPLGRFTEVRLRPRVYAMLDDAPTRGRPDPAESNESLAPTFRFRYRDRSGAWWDYVTGTAWDLTRLSSEPERGLEEVPVPDPRRLTLVLDMGPAPRRDARGRVEVEVTAHLGQEYLRDLRRNGRPVLVRVVVRNARGRAVYSAASALPRLIRMLGKEAYTVQAPRGRCTITATIGPTPFSKATTTSQQVVVE